MDAGADNGIRVIALGLAGRLDEARERLSALVELSELPAFRLWFGHLVAWLDRRHHDMLQGMWVLGPLKIQNDPEAIFQEGWLLCDVGEHAAGLPYLQRAVANGYTVAPTLTRARQFDELRGEPAFQALLAEAEAGRDRALQAFRDAGGETLLGV